MFATKDHPHNRTSQMWIDRHVAHASYRADAPLQVVWARHLEEVRAAQRLRYTVFVQEMGARLPTPLPGHDIDLFDDYCEHLLVRAHRLDLGCAPERT